MLLRFKLNSLDPFDLDLLAIPTEEENSAITMVDMFGNVPMVSTGYNNTFYITMFSKIYKITLDDTQPEHLYDVPIDD